MSESWWRVQLQILILKSTAKNKGNVKRIIKKGPPTRRKIKLRIEFVSK